MLNKPAHPVDQLSHRPSTFRDGARGRTESEHQLSPHDAARMQASARRRIAAARVAQ